MSTQVRTQFRARWQSGARVVVTDPHSPHAGQTGRIRRLMYYEYDAPRGVYEGVYEVAVNGQTVEFDDNQLEAAP